MSNKKDEELIKLFKKLPSITDERPEHVILRDINRRQVRKRRKSIVIPALSSVAGILLFLLLIPTLLQQDLLSSNNSSNDSVQLEKYEGKSIALDNENAVQKESVQHFDTSDQQQSIMTSSLKTAVYEEDMENNEVNLSTILTNDAIVVPISVVVPKGENSSTLQADISRDLKEANPNFYKLNEMIKQAKYEGNSKEVIISIDDSNRDIFEQFENHIMTMLQYNLRFDDVEVVKFTDGHGNPVELGKYGEVPELQINDILKRPYYVYPIENGNKYIVPADLESDNVLDAIADMKVSPSDFYFSLIPENVELEVANENSQLSIRFKEVFDLTEGNQEDNMRMLEGILLTSMEFGYDTVQFENLTPKMWEGINLEEPVRVPLAPNKYVSQ